MHFQNNHNEFKATKISIIFAIMMHPHIQHLLRCIDLEEKEQRNRFRLDEQHTLRQLKAEGLAIHPITINHKTYGYADYPEIEFSIAFPQETNMFKDGVAIECFLQGEEAIKGQLLFFDNKKGAVRLLAPDYPDWIEEKGVGIKLAPDTRTTTIMKESLKLLSSDKKRLALFEQIHSANTIGQHSIFKKEIVHLYNHELNESQQMAVDAIIQNEDITIIHGPPGTGKTTTLIEAIRQLIGKGEKVLVAAPSNTAVDNLAKGLLQKQVKILRVGNIGKIDEAIFPYTTEGKLNEPTIQKEIKQLKKRAEEFRRMALKYKRSFGKAEREQRSLLFKEVKNIRTEIKKLQNYYEDKMMNEASVIIGTPIALYDAQLKNEFHTLVIDEAGQCIEPLAWVIFGMAHKIVLAGDHLQLPPTVLSNEASQLGFNQSILEQCFDKISNICLLNIQYRMKKTIADFSSQYFYDNQLMTAEYLQTQGMVCFIDTAGSGFEEKQGTGGASLENEGEMQIVQKLLNENKWDETTVSFISPYSGQVSLAKTLLSPHIRINTIDSFQGQENEVIIISLVRSNEDGIIGFLNDYRRMNVAITRAKSELYVIGDSATIGNDLFYNSFLQYVEQKGVYKTVWEMDVM